jgi:hypothetical protein
MSQFRDAVAAVFTAKPDQWIPWWEFAAVGGAMAWRTRISELRQPKHGTWAIACKVERREDGVKVSYYKWTPKQNEAAA